MKIGKLFRVLVVGGATAAGGFGCTTSDDVELDGAIATDAMVSMDVTTDVATSDAPTGDAEIESSLCFCNSQPECSDGSNVKDGFECCWGTSC